MKNDYGTEEMYFEVKAKCGHVGRNNYVIKSFGVMAYDGKEAAAKARKLPRVKHDHKDAILSVEKITLERYSQILREHGNDPYFTCSNIQQQRELCKELELIADAHGKTASYKKSGKSVRAVYSHGEKVRKPRKFSFCDDDCDYGMNVI